MTQPMNDFTDYMNTSTKIDRGIEELKEKGDVNVVKRSAEVVSL